MHYSKKTACYVGIRPAVGLRPDFASTVSVPSPSPTACPLKSSSPTFFATMSVLPVLLAGFNGGWAHLKTLQQAQQSSPSQYYLALSPSTPSVRPGLSDPSLPNLVS